MMPTHTERWIMEPVCDIRCIPFSISHTFIGLPLLSMSFFHVSLYYFIILGFTAFRCIEVLCVRWKCWSLCKQISRGVIDGVLTLNVARIWLHLLHILSLKRKEQKGFMNIVSWRATSIKTLRIMEEWHTGGDLDEKSTGGWQGLKNKHILMLLLSERTESFKVVITHFWYS